MVCAYRPDFGQKLPCANQTNKAAAGHLQVDDVVFGEQDPEVPGDGHVALQTTAATAGGRSLVLVTQRGLPPASRTQLSISQLPDIFSASLQASYMVCSHMQFIAGVRKRMSSPQQAPLVKEKAKKILA